MLLWRSEIWGEGCLNTRKQYPCVSFLLFCCFLSFIFVKGKKCEKCYFVYYKTDLINLIKLMKKASQAAKNLLKSLFVPSVLLNLRKKHRHGVLFCFSLSKGRESEKREQKGE